MSFWYDESKPGYAFEHAALHSCRDFDAIYEWAVEHATDLTIE